MDWLAAEHAQIQAEERACFRRLCCASGPEERRSLVAKMAELQDRAAKIEHDQLRQRRSAKARTS
jgi:hypothetical protein